MPNKPHSHDDDLRKLGILRPRVDYDRGYDRMRRGEDAASALLAKLRSSARWQKFRAALLLQSPLCAECARAGRTTVGSDIDHITEARILLAQRGTDGFFDAAACEVLCTLCHGRKSARERYPR